MTNAITERVFISHASADEKFVSKFVNSILIRGAGLRTMDIFYSSANDTGVSSGEYLMERVRGEAGASQLFIAIITPTYQTRPVCVAELGAAWARGVLLPVMAPGMDRSDLEGILPGLLIKSLGDDEVLDEIADRLRDLGYLTSARSFGVGKAEWKSEIRGGLSPASLPVKMTPEEMKKLKQDLEDSQNALDRARSELAEQTRRNDDLSRAKTAAEVHEADLPADERQKFDHLQKQARGALRGLKDSIVEALWHEISGNELLLPDRMDEQVMHDSIRAEVKHGRLDFDEDTGEVTLNTDFLEVENAQEAVAALQAFLVNPDRSEGFMIWFQKEFEMPADLRKKGCWDALL